MEFQLSPSILSADFFRLESQIREIERAGIKWLHLDVMDGLFVPSISFGMPVISSIKKHTSLFFDVHLMIDAPERYLKDFKDAGANLITVHAESCVHLDRTLQQIHELGLKGAVALNPATPINCLEYVLDKVDMVLVMSVNPGFGGQHFIESSLKKISGIREMISKGGFDADIEVDGGVNRENIDDILKAGANIIVAGSAVFASESGQTEERARYLKSRIDIYR